MNDNITLLLRNVCYTGTATQESTTRSFVRGIIETMKKYGWVPTNETAFLSRMSDELYCLGAAAVCPSVHHCANSY
jgi:hypothetical protein